MKRFILLAICLFSLSFTYANEVVRVRKAVGRWEVSDDITPKQAEEKAFNEAKKEALRMAGVMENVWSVFGQVTADNGTEFTEAYSSVSMLAISGMVNVTDKKVEDFWDEGLKRNFKVVTIDALVTKDETQEDKAYALEVKGIEPIYKQTEVLECSFKVYGTDSYLGTLASVLMSCSETIFYTMSVYFMTAKVTKSRYTLAGALFATFVGAIASVILVRL